MDEPIILMLRVLATVVLASAASLGIGRLVLRLDSRGAGVVGGICAGLALGPFVFGQLAPDLFTRVTIASPTLLEEARAEQENLDRDTAAMEGVSAVAIAEHRADPEMRRASDLVEGLQHERSTAVASLALAMGFGAVVLRLGAVPGRRSAAALPEGLLAGLLTVLLLAVPAAIIAGLAPTQALLLGGMLAAGSFAVWNPRTAGVCVGIAAVAGTTLYLVAGPPVLALPAVVVLAWLVRLIGTGGGSTSRPRRARVERVVDFVLVPAVPALLLPMATADVDTTGLVLLALAALFASDAHGVAAVIATRATSSGARAARPLSAWMAGYARHVPWMSFVWLACLMTTGAVDPFSTTGTLFVLLVAMHAGVSELTRPSVCRLLTKLRRSQDSASTGSE